MATDIHYKVVTSPTKAISSIITVGNTAVGVKLARNLEPIALEHGLELTWAQTTKFTSCGSGLVSKTILHSFTLK